MNRAPAHAHTSRVAVPTPAEAHHAVLTPSDLLDLAPEQKRALLAKLLRARASRPSEFRLSPVQRRLVFFEQLEPGTSVMHVPFSVDLRGPLDIDRLRGALNDVAGRHDALRTVFNLDGEEARQIVLPQITVELPVIDLRDLPSEARYSEADRCSREDSARPFDLVRGPLWRTTLLQLDGSQNRLLVTVHHLVFDGSSMPILLRDLAELYSASYENRAPRLPLLRVQFPEFADHQSTTLDREPRNSDLDYWRARLGGTLPVLDLPADHVRPLAQTFRGASTSCVLDPRVVRAIATLGRSHGATAFMTLLAAFKALLSRQTGLQDVIVGTPVAGRTSSESESLVGVFINTLALRTDLSGDPTFADLLARVRSTALDAFDHQELPFDAIVAALQPERTWSRTPAFQVLFNMLDVSRALRFDMGPVVAELSGRVDTPSKFDLTMYVWPAGDSLTLALLYNADLFSQGRMTHLLQQYEEILRQATADPGVRLSNLNLMTGAGRAVLPDPTAPIAVASEVSIASRLRAHARATPHALAVDDRRQQWTFAELDRRSDRLAATLQAGGIGAGDVVAVYAHRSAPLVLALTSILKSGAAFAVLDPAYPTGRLLRCLAEIRPAAFVRIAEAGDVPSQIEDAVATCRLQVRLESEAGAGPDDGIRLAPVPENPDGLTYLAFTSGTTGGVKVVAGSERPLTHFLAWHSATFNLGPEDRFCFLSGLSHDPMLRDVFTPLWVGAPLMIPSQQDCAAPDRLAQWLAAKRITVAHLTPAHLHLLADGTSARGGPLEDLREIFTAGEALTAAMVASVRRTAPSARLINYYGATETPQAMGYWIVPAEAVRSGVAGAGEEGQPADRTVKPAIGQGIDGVQLLVVARDGMLAGVGEPGEILIRTPYLSHGYLNDPALTAERFVPNPFTGVASDRVYRTGDIGRYRADGTVEFVGRRDFQVKVRGVRVELQEVEQVLLQHPAIADAAVVSRDDGAGSTELIAFIVASAEGPAPTGVLRAFLSTAVVAAAIPARFEYLSRMPLTINGKRDRAALADPGLVTAAAPHAQAESPATDTEQRVADLWRQLLRVPSVGRQDNFFQIGGHSLLATRLVSQVRDEFGIALSLRTVFEQPVLSNLAAAIEALRPRIDDDREELEF